jgi:FkbM family methyltransferase
MAEAEDLDTKYLKKEIQILLYRMQALPDVARARLQAELTQPLLEQTLAIDTPRGRVRFVALGRTSVGRAATLLTKQPATIAWIDRFEPNSVFWDIGANIGVYTLYASLARDTRIVAIEPAAVNYFALTANCEINHLGGRVTCLLAAVGRDKAIADLAVSQFAAAASFGFGAKKAQVFEGRQAAAVMPMDQLVDEYGLPCPHYIKIDVPGLTDDILAGGARTLSRPEVREVHIEASEDSRGGRRIIETLGQYGLTIAAADMHGSADLTFIRTGSAGAGSRRG